MTPKIAIALGLIVLFSAVAIIGVLCLYAWVAHGEPDANGDPERDAGLAEDEIAKAASSWDRGSACTARTIRRSPSARPSNPPIQPPHQPKP